VDDGVRVYMDGQAIINQWHDSSTVTYSVEVPMSAGDHVLVIEYYDNIGNAEIEFGYDRVK